MPLACGVALALSAVVSRQGAKVIPWAFDRALPAVGCIQPRGVKGGWEIAPTGWVWRDAPRGRRFPCASPRPFVHGGAWWRAYTAVPGVLVYLPGRALVPHEYALAAAWSGPAPAWALADADVALAAWVVVS